MSDTPARKLTRLFMESSTEDRERKFKKFLAKHKGFQRLSNEVDRLEKELHNSFMKLDKDHPRRKGYEDYFSSDEWKKHL